MTYASHEDVELVEYPGSDVDSNKEELRTKRRRRRTRKRPSKSVSIETGLMSAAEILSRAAKDNNIESSPSSVVTDSGGRKLSALDLDKIVESEEVTCTTETPGSLDSSRSLWELGTYMEDETFTPTIKFPSSRLSSPLSKSSVDDLTAGIDSILESLPKSLSGAKADMRRLCVPSSNHARSNRLCIDKVPRVDISPVTDFFASVSNHFSETFERISNALVESSWTQPDGVSRVLGSLSAPGHIPNSSIPLVNRRQRRAVEFAHDSPIKH